MTSDRRLANAPLIEVIAEVHWEREGGVGDQRFDPSWFALSADLQRVIARRLPQIEELQPLAGFSVPLDMLGKVPLKRFRPAGGGWPLAQLGQGILTVNAVPPYDGWEAVRALLGEVLAAALESSAPLRAARIENLKLHYRDAFTAQHGVQDARRFYVDHMAFASSWGMAALSEAGVADVTIARIDLAGRIPELNASVVVKGNTGTVNRPSGPEDAAIVDFVIQGRPEVDRVAVEPLLQWFDAAHEVVWRLFKDTVPPDLMAKLKEPLA